MLDYTANSLIEWKSEGEDSSVERVLWLDDEIAYVININKNRVPFIRRLKDIDEALANDKAEIKEEDNLIVVSKEEDIPQKHKEIRDRAWEIIRDMVDKEPEIFKSTYRRRLIRQVSKSYGVSEGWILEYLKRYWKRGKTVMHYYQITGIVVLREKRERLRCETRETKSA